MGHFNQHPRCAHYQRIERTWFDDFLSGRVAQVWDSLCPADVIILKDGVKINTNLCVSCLLCAAHCPRSSIAFDQRLHAYVTDTQKCEDCQREVLGGGGGANFYARSNPAEKVSNSVIESIRGFNSNQLRKPLEKFREHTNKDTNTLMRWGSNAIRYLTAGRTAYGVKVKGAEREIRIEMCNIADRTITLWKFGKRADFRFIDRFMIAEDKIKSIVKSQNFSAPMTVYGCYLIGDRESNYFNYANGIDVSVKSRLSDYNLLMFSSVTLWFLVAIKLFLGKNILWSRLLQDFLKNKKNYVFISDRECLEMLQKNIS